MKPMLHSDDVTNGSQRANAFRTFLARLKEHPLSRIGPSTVVPEIFVPYLGMSSS